MSVTNPTHIEIESIIFNADQQKQLLNHCLYLVLNYDDQSHVTTNSKSCNKHFK